MDKIKQFLASTLGRIVLTIVAAVVIYGIFLIVANMDSFVGALIILAVCAYFGWKVLNFITPNFFLILPIGGWIIYYIIKGVIAFFIGFIVAPFQIGKRISDAVAASLSE